MATPATGTASQTTSMSTNVPHPVLREEPGPIDPMKHLKGNDMNFVIISSRWHDEDVVRPLVTACCQELVAKGVKDKNLTLMQVMGVYELSLIIHPIQITPSICP